ncbi:hypothetical protein EC968_006886 [Mortierella alpina]|nr:hypothetical protein EC968_006886 [Mortierella alpina]
MSVLKNSFHVESRRLAKSQPKIEFAVVKKPRTTRPNVSKKKRVVQEQPATEEALEEAAPVIAPSLATRKRKAAPKVLEEPVSRKRKRAVVVRTRVSRGPSESTSEARTRRAAEKAWHEEAVRAARLEKSKKKEAVRHCQSSTWAAEINCGVCLGTTDDDDERYLATTEVFPIGKATDRVIDLETDGESDVAEDNDDEAVDEVVESVIDLETDEGNYDGDDDDDDDDDDMDGDDNGDDIYTQMLETDIDLVELDLEQEQQEKKEQQQQQQQEQEEEEEEKEEKIEE